MTSWSFRSKCWWWWSLLWRLWCSSASTKTATDFRLRRGNQNYRSYMYSHVFLTCQPILFGFPIKHVSVSFHDWCWHSVWRQQRSGLLVISFSTIVVFVSGVTSREFSRDARVVLRTSAWQLLFHLQSLSDSIFRVVWCQAKTHRFGYSPFEQTQLASAHSQWRCGLLNFPREILLEWVSHQCSSIDSY